MNKKQKAMKEKALKQQKTRRVCRALILAGVWILTLTTFWSIVSLIVLIPMLVVLHNSQNKTIQRIEELEIELAE